MRKKRFWLATASIGLFGLSPTGSIAQVPLNTGPFENEAAYKAASSAATIQVPSAASLGLVRAVQLIVSDQVEGGCWTDASSIAAKIRAELERTDVAVYEEPLAFRNVFSPALHLNVLGYRIKGGPCVATASLEIFYFAPSELGSLQYTGTIFEMSNTIVPWSQSIIVSGAPTINESIRDFAEENIDRLSGDILSGRRDSTVKDILAIWNDTTPMTQKAFDEFMKTTSDTPGQ